MYKKILVPVDGSDASKRGLDEAIDLAKIHGSQLRLLHVVSELVLLGADARMLDFEDLIESLRDNGKAVLEVARQRVRKHELDAEIVLEETFGRHAANSIVAQAKSWPADLIVMGTHGRHGLARLALGSDAEIVVRHAPVPVLLARAVD